MTDYVRISWDLQEKSASHHTSMTDFKTEYNSHNHLKLNPELHCISFTHLYKETSFIFSISYFAIVLTTVFCTSIKKKS